MQPLVVTLALPDDVQARLDEERNHWFPAGRTAVGAHVTLFHAVPAALEPDVREALAEQSGPPFDVRVARVMPLGRGAAYAVESAELQRRHRTLQQQWWSHLTQQDRQGLRAHVTVQNKVDAGVARRTVAELSATFVPFDVTAVGFDLWRYDGGPWTHLTRVPFDGPSPRVIDSAERLL